MTSNGSGKNYGASKLDDYKSNTARAFLPTEQEVVLFCRPSGLDLAQLDELVELDHVERQYQAEVFLSPFAAKQLAEWLTNHVKKFEEMFGTINPKLKKRERPPPPPVPSVA